MLATCFGGITVASKTCMRSLAPSVTQSSRSSGDVIDVKTREIVHRLTDEEKRAVGSEKMVEVHWKDGRPVVTGDQFGLGRKR